MNIKNDDVEAEVRLLTSLTGESLTTAIGIAVRERVERVQRENSWPARRARLEAIGREVRERLNGERFPDPNDFLYDEQGLPKW